MVVSHVAPAPVHVSTCDVSAHVLPASWAADNVVLWPVAVHCLRVKGSTIHKARVEGQLPPRLVRVFSRVM